MPCEIRDSAFEARHDPRQADHGRLFVALGRSRYINSEKANQVRANHVFSILSFGYHVECGTSLKRLGRLECTLLYLLVIFITGQR